MSMAMKVTGECDLFDIFETGGRFRLFLAPSITVIIQDGRNKGVKRVLGIWNPMIMGQALPYMVYLE
jgi:hypothetical protein